MWLKTGKIKTSIIDLYNKLESSEKQNELSNLDAILSTILIFLSSVLISLALSGFIKNLDADFPKLLFIFLVFISLGIFGIFWFRVSRMLAKLENKLEDSIKFIGMTSSFLLFSFFMFLWAFLLSTIIWILKKMVIIQNSNDCLLQIIFIFGNLLIVILICIFNYNPVIKKLKSKYITKK